MAGARHRADAARMLDDRGYTGHLIRGQPPHLLIEEGVRHRIVNSYYWKEQCFGLNAATLCDRAAELTCVGGTYNAGQRATPFLCLVFKMLQLGVEEDILEEYLKQEDFKYLRAVAAFYVRLTAEASESVYTRLEPLLLDKRKLRRRGNNGFGLTYVDEFVDGLLAKERVCATSLWKLVPRGQLEDEDKLEERVSPVAWMLESDNEEEEKGKGSEVGGSSASSRSRFGSRSDAGSRSRSRSISPSDGVSASGDERKMNGHRE
ncbi:MAG: hypothetical protein M1831_002149 [Alyxoria varia]|nr:MAG: hypothetical protein M1831_002149 [Alyxoria varia]